MWQQGRAGGRSTARPASQPPLHSTPFARSPAAADCCRLLYRPPSISTWHWPLLPTSAPAPAVCPCRYHQYKFIVDGEWRHDESQPFMPDPLGNVNNWLFVRKPEGQQQALGAAAGSPAASGHNSGCVPRVAAGVCAGVCAGAAAG